MSIQIPDVNLRWAQWSESTSTKVATTSPVTC